MEKSNRVHTRSIRALMLLLVLSGVFAASLSFGATIDVYMRADTFTKTMPDGEVITMWGYVLTDDTFTPLPGEIAKVPGPTLTATAGDTLRIHIQNNLTGLYTEPTSVIIPGQPPSLAAGTYPTWTDGTIGPRTSVNQRVRSFTTETAVLGTGIYTFTALRAGTYLYQSGTHPGVQVQMGLYGVLIVRLAGGAPYTGIAAPAQEVTLLFSEIDPELHYSIESGRYGAAPPPPPAKPLRGQRTSPEDYHPKYFLINGEPYSPSLSPIPAGNPNQRLLIRFLNAGLLEKTPTLLNQYMSIIAEDGSLYPYSKEEYSVLLPAGKTMDAILTPTTAGYIPVFDRSLNLTNAASSPGGMLAYLDVASTQHTLSITKAGTGTGRVVVTSLPGGIDCGLICTQTYNAGTILTLLATPDPGVPFGGWTGVDPGTEALNPATVTMNGDINVTATFGTGIAGAITLTSPNGGEVWQRGQTQTITWNYIGAPGPYVRIQAVQGTQIRTIALRARIGSNGSGSFTKRIPRSFGLTGADIKIVITVLKDKTITDTSDDFFTINP